MTTYCEEHQFHLSFLPRPTHDVLILCMKRWATKTRYDSSDEMSFQNIPTNWFPKITLCRNKLWKSIGRKRVCVRMCVCVCVYAWEEFFTYSGEDEKWDHILVHVTVRHNGQFAFERVSFSFHMKKGNTRFLHIPGSVWSSMKLQKLLKSEIVHKIHKMTLCRGLTLMENYVRIGNFIQCKIMSSQALMGSTEECIVGKSQLEHTLCCRLQPCIRPMLVNKWLRFHWGLCVRSITRKG